MSAPAGCTIARLDAETCRVWLQWALGTEGSTCPNAPLPSWLLAVTTGGILWGREDAGKMRLASTHPRATCALSEETLLEMRLFGQDREILIWKTDDGPAGRILADRSNDSADEALSPAERTMLLRGDRVLEGPVSGFTRIGDGTGCIQIVPLEVHEAPSLRLAVRHYFEQDDESGEVRVAASRLVGLESVGKENA